jgi:hypothetical protein
VRLILAVAVLLLAGAGTGTSALPRCARDLPQLETHPPLPVVVTTNCARFRLGADGKATYEGPWTSPVPQVARGYWMDYTWFGLEHHHIVIGRAMERLWRSQDVFRGDVGRIALGRGDLAFSYYHGRRPALYVAPFGGREHQVARGEWPVAFTNGVLVTQSSRGTVVLRGLDGRRIRELARHASDVQVDQKSRIVFFRVTGRLFSYDGIRVRELGSLRKLGLTAKFPVVEPLGRLVALRDQQHLVVVDHDGHVVARTPLPRGKTRADGVSSAVVANAAATAVAFTATSGNTAYVSRGSETVYLLRAGEHQARPVLSEKLHFKVCERMADLSWRGRYLLYSDTEQRAAVVDASGRAVPVELGSAIKRLPGLQPDGRFDVSWA